jgi:hypothetical protein
MAPSRNLVDKGLKDLAKTLQMPHSPLKVSKGLFLEWKSPAQQIEAPDLTNSTAYPRPRRST